MRQLEPTFGEVFEPEIISEILGLKVEEINSKYPIEVVSTGLPTIIVPIRKLSSVRKASINTQKYLEFTSNIIPQTILIFSSQTISEQNDLNVRFFAERFGIAEDPATGSANGCLGGYLIKHKYFQKEKIELRIEQGFEIGRPSLILFKGEKKGKEIIIHVGGKVKLIAKGELF